MHDDDKALPPMTPQVIVKLGELLKATMSESRVTYLDQHDEIRRGRLRHGLWQHDGSYQPGQVVTDNTHLRITHGTGLEAWISLAYLTRKFLNSELMLER